MSVPSLSLLSSQLGVVVLGGLLRLHLRNLSVAPGQIVCSRRDRLGSGNVGSGGGMSGVSWGRGRWRQLQRFDVLFGESWVFGDEFGSSSFSSSFHLDVMY